MADPATKEQMADPKSASEWISKIDKLYSEQERSRFPYERQWYLNIAMVLGYQWAQWNNVTKRIEEPKVPSWRVRLVANRILSNVLLWLAKMTKVKPQLMTVPATSEEEDKNAARIGDKVLEALWRKLDMDVRIMDVLLWARTTGNSFFKVFWNPKAGPRIQYQLDWEGEPMVDEQSGQTPAVAEDGISQVYKEFQLGDVAIEIVSPFEVYVDPMARLGIRPRWMLHAKPRPLDYIKEMYPERGGQVKPESGLTSLNSFESRIMTLMASFSAGATADTQEEENIAIVKEYWEEPSDKYPRGKVVTVANGVLLQEQEWPEENLEPDSSLDFGPFVKFIDVPIPGRYWAGSMVEQLTPLQMNYNKSRSQIIESRNLMSKPKVLEPRGSQIAQSSITSEPGERVTYTPIGGMKPEFWTPPSLPNYVFEELKETLADIDEVSGIHQVSRGQAPQGVRAGIAIRFLQEMDDTMFGPTIRRFESALSRTGTLILRIVQKHYKESRTLQVVGKGREIEVFDFQGADLRNNTDVAVQAGSGFPELKSARQQYILDLYEKGLFGAPDDPATRGKVLRMLELGDVDTAFEDERIDERVAEQEIRLMKQGYPIEPQYVDNHITHMQVKHRFMKTDEFRNLPDEIKELFYQHDGLHAQMLAPTPPAVEPPTPGEQPTVAEEVAPEDGAADQPVQEEEVIL